MRGEIIVVNGAALANLPSLIASVRRRARGGRAERVNPVTWRPDLGATFSYCPLFYFPVFPPCPEKVGKLDGKWWKDSWLPDVEDTEHSSSCLGGDVSGR